MGGSPLQFFKFNATGNDFVLLEGPLAPPPAQLARLLCPRRLALGADGLVVVEGPAPWRVAHYEPTGERTFCLNALRGVAAWALEQGHWIRDSLRLQSDVGLVEVRRGSPPRIALPPPLSLEPCSLTVAGRNWGGFQVDVGNPQFVVLLPDAELLEHPHLMEWAREIRWRTDVFREGTNVDFVCPVGERFAIRTFERGVEDETLSCGSGIVASACALWRQSARSDLTFLTRGGEEQRVELELTGDEIHRAWSAGAVRLVARGELLLDVPRAA